MVVSKNDHCCIIRMSRVLLLLLLVLIVAVHLGDQQPRGRRLQRWRPIRLTRRSQPLTNFNRAPSEQERYHIAVPSYAANRDAGLDRRRRRRRRRGGRAPPAPVSSLPPPLFVPQAVELSTELAVAQVQTDSIDFV